MALRLIEDFFELGANPENVSGSGWQPSGGRVAGSGCVGSGNAGSSPQAGTGLWIAYAGQGWNAPINEIFVGFALRTSVNINTPIISFLSNSATNTQITLGMDGSNRLYLSKGESGGSTVLGSSSIPFPVLNQWRSINIRIKMSSTNAATDGGVTLKVDGITHFEATNIVTRAAGAAGAGIDGIRITLPSNAQPVCAVSDLVVCDNTGTINNSYPQDVAVIRRLPNGNGFYHEFMGSDGNFTDNYLLVSDSPTNTATYTYATEDGQRDSYQVEDLPAATISVKGVRAVAKTAKSGAGIASMSVFVRENGEDAFGPDVPLSTSYSWQGDIIRERAPSTNLPWTVEDVNEMEIGVRSEAS